MAELSEVQRGTLRLMPCGYEGWAPPQPGERAERRSLVIDELVSLGLVTLNGDTAVRTAEGDAAVAV